MPVQRGPHHFSPYSSKALHRTHLDSYDQFRHVGDLVGNVLNVGTILDDEDTHGSTAKLEGRRSVMVRMVPEGSSSMVARNHIFVWIIKNKTQREGGTLHQQYSHLGPSKSQLSVVSSLGVANHRGVRRQLLRVGISDCNAA